MILDAVQGRCIQDVSSCLSIVNIRSFADSSDSTSDGIALIVKFTADGDNTDGTVIIIPTYTASCIRAPCCRHTVHIFCDGDIAARTFVDGTDSYAMNTLTSGCNGTATDKYVAASTMGIATDSCASFTTKGGNLATTDGNIAT